MNIGDISISLLLNNKQFSESIKTSLNLLKMFKGNADSILKGISPTFKSTDFDKEVSKGEVALNKIKDASKKSDDAVKQFGNTADRSGQQTTKLAGVLTNAGLRFEGLRSIVSVLKSTLGDFFDTYNKFNSAQTGLSSIASFKGLNPEIAKQELQNLKAVKEGLLDVGNASTAFKNLLAANFTMEQSIQIIDRLSSSAAFGRQASLSFGDAVSSATEGIKNGNSILVDNAGVTKNLSMMLEEAGFKAQDLMKAGTDSGVRMAIFNGILKETTGQLGDIDKLSQTSAGSVAKYDAAMLQLKVKFGEFIATAAVPFLEKATEVLKWLSNADPAIQKLALTLALLSAAFLVLNNSIGSTPYILISMLGAVAALPPGLKEMAIALGVLALALRATNGDLTKLITGFGNLKSVGVSSVSSLGSSIAANLGPASIAFLAILAIMSLIDDAIKLFRDLAFWKEKIADIETNQTKIDYIPNTGSDGTRVPLQTDEKGKLKILTEQEARDLGIHPDGTSYGPEIDDQQRRFLKDQKATDDQLKEKGTSKGGSKDTGTKEEIGRLKELQEQLKKVGDKLTLNKGLLGAEIDLLKEKHRIENEIYYVQTGFDLDKTLEDNKNVISKQINDQLELYKLKQEQTKSELEAYLNAFDDIHNMKIDLMDDEHEKKLAQIEDEREKELNDIKSRNISEDQKAKLKELTNNKFDKEINKLGINLEDFKAAQDIASQIQGIFNFGGHTLFSKFLGALQITQQIVALLQSLQLAQGLFSFI
ncbi:MAG: hypothetical protein ABI528_09375, partial [bacterium]